MHQYEFQIATADYIKNYTCLLRQFFLRSFFVRASSTPAGLPKVASSFLITWIASDPPLRHSYAKFLLRKKNGTKRTCANPRWTDRPLTVARMQGLSSLIQTGI